MTVVAASRMLEAATTKEAPINAASKKSISLSKASRPEGETARALRNLAASRQDGFPGIAPIGFVLRDSALGGAVLAPTRGRIASGVMPSRTSDCSGVLALPLVLPASKDRFDRAGAVLVPTRARRA